MGAELICVPEVLYWINRGEVPVVVAQSGTGGQVAPFAVVAATEGLAGAKEIAAKPSAMEVDIKMPRIGLNTLRARSWSLGVEKRRNSWFTVTELQPDFDLMSLLPSLPNQTNDVNTALAPPARHRRPENMPPVSLSH